jgi:hypothetical protein
MTFLAPAIAAFLAGSAPAPVAVSHSGPHAAPVAEAAPVKPRMICRREEDSASRMKSVRYCRPAKAGKAAR